MLRHLWFIAFVGSLVLGSGCKKFTGTAAKPAKTNQIAGTGSKSVEPRQASASPATNSPSMQRAYGSFERSAKGLVDLLKSVVDDASARSAAPKLGPAGAELGEAMKQLKVTVAALETSGRKAEVNEFYQKLAERMAKEGDASQPADNLESEIERVALGPQGPLLRSQINTILDAMLDGATIRQKAKWQEWISQKRLRG